MCGHFVCLPDCVCVCVCVCKVVRAHICVSGWFRLCKPSTQPSVTKGPPCSEANHLLPTASRILALLSNNGPARQTHIHTRRMTTSATCSYQQAHTLTHTNLTITQTLALKTVKALSLIGENLAFIAVPSSRLFGSSESLWSVAAISWVVLQWSQHRWQVFHVR